MTTPTNDNVEAISCDDQQDDPNSIDVRVALVEIFHKTTEQHRKHTASMIKVFDETLALKEESLALKGEIIELKNEIIASLRRRLAIYEPDLATPRPAS